MIILSIFIAILIIFIGLIYLLSRDPGSSNYGYKLNDSKFERHKDKIKHSYEDLDQKSD